MRCVLTRWTPENFQRFGMSVHPRHGPFCPLFLFLLADLFFIMYKRDGTRVGEFDVHKHQGESEA